MFVKTLELKVELFCLLQKKKAEIDSTHRSLHFKRKKERKRKSTYKQTNTQIKLIFYEYGQIFDYRNRQNPSIVIVSCAYITICQGLHPIPL